MPGVELSSLNRNEMRRLLAAAETRRDHALAARLRTELDGRGATAVQSIHPLAGQFERDPGHEEVDSKDWGASDWDTKIWDDDDGDGRWMAWARGRIGLTVLAVAVTSVVAMAIGWQLGRREVSASGPPPAAVVEPAQVVAAAPLVAELQPPEPAAPRPAQLAVEVAPPPPLAAKPAAKPGKAQAERRAERRAAAGRLPRDRRMLQAYERARAAGADPLTLDADQARFRTAVGATRDPVRTNTLYERRIQELEAAARRAK